MLREERFEHCLIETGKLVAFFVVGARAMFFGHDTHLSLCSAEVGCNFELWSGYLSFSIQVPD
jgi:hypothetical protein